MKRLDRTVSRLTTLSDDTDDGYVPGTMAERIDMVWDITVALWSVSTGGRINAQSRLQRDVAVLRKAPR